MRYSAENYAKAFAEIASGKLAPAKEKILVENFIKLIKKNGDEGKLVKIYALCEKFLRKKQGLRKITLESARSLKKSPKSLLKNFLKKDDLVEERINPSLIAGIKIIQDEEKQLDFSLQKKLNQIFR